MAALAASSGTTPGKMPLAEVRAVLAKHGAVVPPVG
jgi:hypothetical protein